MYHCIGAFQTGCKVCIAYNNNNAKEQSLVFDCAYADVICRKDTSELINKTTGPQLKAVFQKIAHNTLSFGVDDNGVMRCCFGAGEEE